VRPPRHVFSILVVALTRVVTSSGLSEQCYSLTETLCGLVPMGVNKQIDLPQNMFFDDVDEQDTLLTLRCTRCNLVAHFSPEFAVTVLTQRIQEHICGRETNQWHAR
jgi:hypothetical protein